MERRAQNITIDYLLLRNTPEYFESMYCKWYVYLCIRDFLFNFVHLTKTKHVRDTPYIFTLLCFSFQCLLCIKITQARLRPRVTHFLVSPIMTTLFVFNNGQQSVPLLPAAYLACPCTSGPTITPVLFPVFQLFAHIQNSEHTLPLWTLLGVGQSYILHTRKAIVPCLQSILTICVWQSTRSLGRSTGCKLQCCMYIYVHNIYVHVYVVLHFSAEFDWLGVVATFTRPLQQLEMTRQT